MKNSVIRLLAIFLMGMVVYFKYYEDDEVGLSAFFAYIFLIVVTIIISIPIIFIKNRSRLLKKIGLVFLSLCIAIFAPLLGIGKLKYVLEDSLYNSTVHKASKQFNVKLPNKALFVRSGNHLMVDNGDGTLSVFATNGKEVNRTEINKLAKDAVPHLPLSDEQKSTTYYDGYTPQKLSYRLFKKINDSQIAFSFRYVTSDVPANYEPEPDMPNDARDILFHYSINYIPTIDGNGEFVFDSKNFKKENYYLVSYKGPGIEAIVAPARAKLVSDLK